MILKIKNIILYSKNNNLKPRVIKFEDDKVNVITGYSKRGKSSIIEIIDYCLGNSESNLPIGLIRDSVEVFALKLNINGQDVFIGRDSPKKGENNSQNMYYQEIEKLGEYPQFNTNEWLNNREDYRENRESIKNTLNVKAGFRNIAQKKDYNDNEISIGFRDTTAFQFQSQSIIANGNTIFYNTDTFKHTDRLKTLFPLVLGYKSYDIILLDSEIKTLENDEKKILDKIEDINSRYENWKSELYEYYTEAIRLGLTNEDIDLQISNVDLVKTELSFVISQVRKNILLKTGNTVAFSEKLNELQIKRDELTRVLQSKKIELNKILKFENTKKEYLDTVYKEINEKLKPIDWFLKQKGVDNCPFCNSKSEYAFQQLQRLKEVNFENSKLLNLKENDTLNFDKEKLELKKTIKEQEEVVREFDSNIDILIKDTEDNQTSYQLIYEFAGKVSNFLKNVNSPAGKYTDDLFLIQNELKGKRKRLSKLKEKFNKEFTLSKVTKSIKKYVDMLPIENKEFSNVILDPERYLGIKIHDSRDDSQTFLNKIGSGSNYMCYHIATMLGLHEFFYKLKDNSKTNYVPSFLVLDQPSQVYYPEQSKKNNKIQTSEDAVNTRKIFEVCSKFMQNTNNEIQIIILEHAPKETWEGIKNIKLIEEWRGKDNDFSDNNYNALIQSDWHLNM